LAALYYSQGLYAKAESLFAACFEKRLVVLGESHPDTLGSENNLAGLYYSQGRYVKAESLFASCFEKYLVVLGESHPDTINTKEYLDLVREQLSAGKGI
jgi:tetratricopeptide (TPR) repeat protein